MSLLAKLAAAAGFAALALTGLPDAAEAQYRHGDSRSSHYDRDWFDYGRHSRWNGPEGYFVVNARACPDLRQDVRDAWRGSRYDHPRYGHGRVWRDRRVLDCPHYAWDYVPSRREARAGRHGDRLQPDIAFWDHRTNRYYAQTRWGPVPVHVNYDQRHDPRHYRGRSGVHFEFRF